MSHDNAPFAVHEPVTVIDQLRVRPGQRRAVLDLFEQVYKPLAAERGLEWLHTHCAPPFEREGAGGDIHIHWRYPSLGALWGARGVEETDPRLASFWRIQLAPLIESRTRQLGRPAPLRAFPVAGPEPAGPARIPGRREILFLRPRVAVPAADQPRWLAALDGLVGQQGIRACRSGFNAGGYTGREGEISCDLLLAEGAALPVSLIENSLPGPVAVDEVVTPAVPVAWGWSSRPLGNGVKRTILLKTRDDAGPDAIATMEQVLVEWARQLPEMASWSLSRVSAGNGPIAWSHCYEQEFTEASAVLGSYLNHPFHWAVVDRYFHPEGHEQTADAFFHSIYPITASVLAPMLAGGEG